MRRIPELIYVKYGPRWIDPSFKRLSGDLIRLIEERFISLDGPASLLQNPADLDNRFATTKKIVARYPEANTQLINSQNMQHYLLLCQLRPEACFIFFLT